MVNGWVCFISGSCLVRPEVLARYQWRAKNMIHDPQVGTLVLIFFGYRVLYLEYYFQHPVSYTTLLDCDANWCVLGRANARFSIAIVVPGHAYPPGTTCRV